MKRYILSIILCLTASCAWAFPPGFLGVVGGGAAAPVYMGINFRATSGYVTDGTGETYCQGASDIYPVSRGGYTLGWETNGSLVDSRDRSTSGDVRLAGTNVINNNGSDLPVFRIDLPSTGTYTIRLAFGDAQYSQSYHYAVLKDDTTTFSTIDDSNGTAANEFTDATGTNRTAAAWPGSNASITRTFTSTILRIQAGTPTNVGGATTITHLSVTK